MKNCELCNGLARIYCESDHANLCWNCDLKVHSANFLVAKHSRSLLCNVCQSPTAWSATGAKIGRTVSVCERCMNDERTDGEEEDEVEEEEDVEEIDLEDIQVVPWSSTPPPQPASSSSSNESLTTKISLKRMREDEDSGTSTSHVNMELSRGDGESAEFVNLFSVRKSSNIEKYEEILSESKKYHQINNDGAY